MWAFPEDVNCWKVYAEKGNLSVFVEAVKDFKVKYRNTTLTYTQIGSQESSL